ncbi:hypothetical protein Kpol_2000p95 [Vanderwaltozyma polyspora DSM 70294]|uniref:SH3 domain-containing protein n=1 Tax=Vanderwaltozyma polyspora (strain ATCC 22028 / DSM 70294 / BCRC 21397 / CBS 2163 / NBRC 10782 / NRRL Y-8283 / UCD 57-17) TaxID=436907 RepID=A7TFA2_VANPO|nr:uncharacterized protein Kpol_2000p95 [Vanderwaltozyma polyspora DSM 70294]EDO19127.1 hypothetical protein Kpol_2000p95 [Vanderwaltozyma polyspora DSM 70294]
MATTTTDPAITTIFRITTTLRSSTTHNSSQIRTSNSISTTLSSIHSYSESTDVIKSTISAIQSQSVTKVYSSALSVPTYITIDGESNSSKSSGKTIGLAIGLPVGIVCLLLCILLFLYLKKDYFHKSTKVVSPTESNKPIQSNWFNKCLYSSKPTESNEEYINEKRLPFTGNMSSKVQYKISKDKSQHILTPKKSVAIPFGNPNFDKSIETVDVEKLLYTEPPNIHHIPSTFPSMENIVNTKLTKKHSESGSDAILTNWKYESPLSRWFLRGSTYLEDPEAQLYNETPTSTVQLKRLKILSRIHKEYVDLEKLENERSPILATSDNYFSGSESKHDAASSSSVKRPTSAIYGTIGVQTLELGENQNRVKVIKIGSVPEDKKRGKKNSKKKRMKIKKHLEYLSHIKPLPLTPKTKYKIGDIKQVVEQYEARLTDEIDLKVGEYVKILATHTDGWCLLEKCTGNGTAISKYHLVDVDVTDKRYLNDDRGIAPGRCIA